MPRSDLPDHELTREFPGKDDSDGQRAMSPELQNMMRKARKAAEFLKALAHQNRARAVGDGNRGAAGREPGDGVATADPAAP